MTRHGDLLIALRQISHAIDLHSRQLARQTGLTFPQLLVLQALAGAGRAKPSAIARDVSLSQATVTSIADRLEQAGLVERQRGDADRRVLELVLTQSGRQSLAAVPEPLQAGFVAAFGALEPWEQSLLVSSVQRIASMMNAGSAGAAPFLAPGDLPD